MTSAHYKYGYCVSQSSVSSRFNLGQSFCVLCARGYHAGVLANDLLPNIYVAISSPCLVSVVRHRGRATATHVLVILRAKIRECKAGCPTGLDESVNC